MTERSNERVDPADAFGLVANVNRFEIVEALWDADADALGFAALHDRTGIDDSGQFNYHLDQLVPRFVRDGTDGYELTYAGKRVVGTAYSGVYTETEAVAVDPIPVAECPNCEHQIEAEYEDAKMLITCSGCDLVVTDLEAPPIVATGYDREELPAAFGRWLRKDIETMNGGFCRYCSGRVTISKGRTFDPAGEEDLDGFEEPAPDDDLTYVGVAYDCEECGSSAGSVLGTVVLDHPAVVAFHHEHGIDLQETPLWELDWIFGPHGEVLETEPPRTRVTVELDDESLVCVLDENFDVIDTDRRAKRK